MLASSRETLKLTKSPQCTRLPINCGCYYVVPRADRQDAQQALTKKTPHVEPNDPDAFIIALLHVDKNK